MVCVYYICLVWGLVGVLGLLGLVGVAVVCLVVFVVLLVFGVVLLSCLGFRFVLGWLCFSCGCNLYCFCCYRLFALIVLFLFVVCGFGF